MTEPAQLLFDDHLGHDGIMQAVRTDLTSPLLDDTGKPLNLDEYATDWLSEEISDGNVYVKDNASILWRLEWNDGALWAIHPNTEWCESRGVYVFDCPDDDVWYQVGEHFVVAIVNGDVTGLIDSEEKILDAWLAEHPEFKSCSGASQGFTQCEITGEANTCYKVW